MDTMETNVILKYRRVCDCWICPDCSCENMMADATCTVCGAYQAPNAVILRAGSEEMAGNPYNYPPNTASGYASASSGGVYYGHGGPTPPPGGYIPPTPPAPDSGSNTGMIITMIAIVLVVIAVATGIISN